MYSSMYDEQEILLTRAGFKYSDFCKVILISITLMCVVWTYTTNDEREILRTELYTSVFNFDIRFCYL